jgi:molybdenum cofactor cytidylyltransferase
MTDQVSAILLAGGKSRRMGVCKQTLVFAAKPVIVHCVDALLDAGLARITVVVGKYGNAIRMALRNVKVDIVENVLPDTDMADSVRTGLTAMGHLPAAVMICLSDHPMVQPGTIGTLLEMQRMFPRDILIPVYRGKNGHPVIFPTELLKRILHGGTLRDIIQANPDRVQRIPVDDAGVVMDIDTQEDYQNLLAIFNQSR